jgi:hypothetical protein
MKFCTDPPTDPPAAHIKFLIKKVSNLSETHTSTKRRTQTELSEKQTHPQEHVNPIL